MKYHFEILVGNDHPNGNAHSPNLEKKVNDLISQPGIEIVSFHYTPETENDYPTAAILYKKQAAKGARK